VSPTWGTILDVASDHPYPFVPKSTAHLLPGQYWGIALHEGKWACGRILATREPGSEGSRSWLVGALTDWVGASPPTEDDVRASGILEVGNAHVDTIRGPGSEVLGHLPLTGEEVTLAEEPVVSYWSPEHFSLSAQRLVEIGPRRFREERAAAGWFSHIRELRSPLTPQMLTPLGEEISVVQFSEPLSDPDLGRVAEFMKDYPDVNLRAYFRGAGPDLDWLRHFSGHRNVSVDAFDVGSFDGLGHLPESLQSLALGRTRKRLSLRVLERFTQLETLHVEGHTKDIDVLSQLRTLENLTLRSVTLPDLSILLPLRRLWSLDLKLGGTTDLRLLSEIGSLKYLELWMIRGLDDISSISDLPNLRFLFMQSLRRVTAIPDLSGCDRLRRIHLETMKGINDLSPLAAAPALEQLLLFDMGHLRLEDIEPLRDHKTLQSAGMGLGSIKRNRAAAEMLGLPGPLPPPDDLFD
jgi:internalin A